MPLPIDPPNPPPYKSRPAIPATHFWFEREKLDAFIERCDQPTRERAALYLALFGQYILANERQRPALKRRLAALEVEIVAAVRLPQPAAR